MKIINSIEDLYGIANNNDTIQKVVENDTLFGRFSHYAKEPLTQEDIDDCLAEVAYLQDLRTKPEHQYIDWEKYDIFDERIYFDETLKKFIIKDEQEL